MKPIHPRTLVLYLLFLIAGGYGGYVISRPAADDGGDKRSTRTDRRAAAVQLRRSTVTSDGNREKIFTDKDMKVLIDRLQKGMTNEEFKEELLTLIGLLPESSFAIRILATKWAEMDPLGAIKALEDIDKKNLWGGYAANMILEKWSESNPVASARFYLENKDCFPHPPDMGKIISNFLKVSPEEAWIWLKEMEKVYIGNIHIHHTVLFFHELSKSDPRQMEKFINLLNTSSPSANYLLNKILNSWVEVDTSSAEKWLRDQPGPLKNDLEPVLIGAIFLQNRERALGMYEKLDKYQKANALDQIKNAMLSNHSYQETIEFMNSLSDDWDDPGMQSVYYKWQNDHPSEFEEWIRQQPRGKIRDKAINVYSGNHDFLNFEEAAELVNSISNEDMRSMSMENVLSRWQRENPEQLKAWVENSDLPQENKQQWLEEK